MTVKEKICVLVVVLAIASVGYLQMRSHAEQTTLVKVDGSSTVFPITEAVAEEFQQARVGRVHVTVGISGTGGGFKKFCRGETDVQDASRPISSDEMEACRKNGVQYYELPVAYDALTIVASPQATWIDAISVADLKKMWEPTAQSRITKWTHVRSSWPDAPLKLFGPGSDSGTFDYFTEAVVGKAKASRGDYTASEDDNTLVQGVSRDKYALGYFGYAYFDANRDRLKAVAVDSGNGPVLPSRETVENGTYQPLSRPVFIYVSSKSSARPEVTQFVEFYLTHGPKLVDQVKYVPLPESAYEAALANFKSGKMGTAFQGTSTVGLKIEDLLRREAKL
ncbi:MAG TPA: PstS family phosphate ABC transporter substrate-binding protein [Nitrospiraceae bacterium]|jgi:phosphate transport system substrate-binding protein|nr:PstS family phosphate ABC transporter substrate-binding protein [Nitrospiraceae bacterium]